MSPVPEDETEMEEDSENLSSDSSSLLKSSPKKRRTSQRRALRTVIYLTLAAISCMTTFLCGIWVASTNLSRKYEVISQKCLYEQCKQSSSNPPRWHSENKLQLQHMRQYFRNRHTPFKRFTLVLKIHTAVRLIQRATSCGTNFCRVKAHFLKVKITLSQNSD
jgi:hypothetical protein